MLRIAAATWGFLGVVSFLAYTIMRLGAHCFVAWQQPFTSLQAVVLCLVVVFMAYFEGYKGFQKGFSPRVAARVLYLRHHANWLQALFAPLFCLGYFGTTRRRQISVIILTLLLLVLITAVRSLEQPWRGIIDAGVVVGLSWGLLAFIGFTLQAFLGSNFNHSAEVSHDEDLQTMNLANSK